MAATGQSTKKKSPGPRATTSGSALATSDQTNWRAKMKPNGLKFDDRAKLDYCIELSKHGLKGQAARTVGLTLQTIQKHRKVDPDFAIMEAEALEEYRDAIVGHVGTLALEGTLRRRFNRDGEVVEEWIEYPTRLIELEAKRLEPAYREKQTLDVNMSGGIMVAPVEKTPEEWAAEQTALNAEKESPVKYEDENEIEDEE